MTTDPLATLVIVQTSDDHKKVGIYSATRADTSKPVEIDWGDGIVDNVNGNISQKVHEYAGTGDFAVVVSNITAISLNSNQAAWRQTTTDNETVVAKVSIGRGVKSLGQQGLLGCTGLKSLRLPKTLSSMGTYAADACSSLSSLVFTDGLSAIPTGAFRNCTSLSALELPKSLMTIGGAAFYNIGITKLVIPEGTLSIFGNSAFENCLNLTEVHVPTTFKRFGYAAFSKDTKLSAVYIKDLDAWCRIYFEGNTGDDRSIGNPLRYAHNLYLNGKLVAHVDIPSGMSAIGQYVFWNGSCISSVSFPEELKSIEQYAFVNCSLTGEIDIPHGVTYVGNGAFGGNKFSSINIPDTVTYFGSSNCNSNGNLLSLYIPDSVTNEFTGCQGAQNLRTVYIGENVPGIGMNAFYYCQQLSSIHLGEKVSYIGRGAFFDCSKLLSIDLPAALTSIGDQCFYNVPLSSLSFPDSLVKIGYQAFFNNKAKGNLQLPASLSSLGNRAFTGSKLLSSVSIPSSLVEIGYGAFADCSIMSAYFVDEQNPSYMVANRMLLTKDGKKVFAGVTGNVQVPEGVEVISYGAFASITGLVSIDLPSSLSTIGEYAFQACHGLKSVAIPASVQLLKNRAFNNCTGLSAVEFLGDAPTCEGTDVFNAVKSGCVAKIPADPALWAGYSTGDTWNRLKIQRKTE